MIDPPEGWRYGFPKAYDKNAVDSDEELREWLVQNGYPAKLLDETNMRGIRMWGGE
jgi:hypothetical protein